MWGYFGGLGLKGRIVQLGLEGLVLLWLNSQTCFIEVTPEILIDLTGQNLAHEKGPRPPHSACGLAVPPDGSEAALSLPYFPPLPGFTSQQ